MFAENFSGTEMKKDDMGRACDIQGGWEEFIRYFVIEN